MYIFDYVILLNKCLQYNIILKGIMVEIATKTIKIGQKQAKTDEIGQKSPGNELQNAQSLT